MIEGTARLVAGALLLGAVSCAAPEANRPPPTRADSLVRLADSTYRQSHDSARRLYDTALAVARQAGDSLNMARALTGIGMAARLDGDYAESRRLGEAALALKRSIRAPARDLFRSLNALGLVAWNDGRLADAASLFGNAAEAAREARDSSAMGMVLVNDGLVANDLGAFERARDSYERGRDVARSVGDSVTYGRALNNLAALLITLGDPLQAIASIEQARQLARATADSALEVNARGQLATAYSALGEPQRAFALIDSALVMAERRGQRRETAEDLMLLADLFLEASDYPHALDYYQRALAATDSLGEPEERGNIRRSEARAHAGMGNTETAVERATMALTLHREGGVPYAELHDHLALASFTRALGRTADAEGHVREARRLAVALEAPAAMVRVALAEAEIAAASRDWNRVLRSLDGVRADLDLAGSEAEAEAMSLRARALGALGQLEAALAAGRRAISAVERVRANYATGELRTSYASGRADVYADQVLLLLRLGRAEAAYEVADAARGRALLEHLAAARGDTGAAIAGLVEREALLRRIDALVARLRERDSVPPRERSPALVATSAALRDSLSVLRGTYEALVARAAVSGALAATRAGLTPANASEVRRSLRPGEVLLEYLVTTDRLVLFVVSSSGAAAHVIPERAASLASRVQLARDLLARPGASAPALAVLRALHDVAIGPAVRSGALRDARRLIVVPHGVLTYLPFAALVDPATGRHLAEDYALLHVPASGALPALRAATATTAGRATVFAPVPDRLPATRAEAREVAAVLPGSAVYIGRDATESRLREALGRGGIVHVASHATLNSRNPLFSYVELASGPAGGTLDNGRLDMHEMLGLSLDSPLVFLSGCETAVGGAWATRFDTGEDYATLGQTMLFAGARNVVATLWRIDDAGAAVFAERFYRALGGQAAPEALAAAQRQMMDDARFRAPYYWAAYLVSGGGEGEGWGRANRTAGSDR